MPLKQIIRRAVLSLFSDDEDQFHVVQGKYNQKAVDIEVVYPYGYCANAPNGALILLFNAMDQEENRAGIAYYPQKRFKKLKEWEVKLGNFNKESFVFFDEDGNIEVHAGDDKDVIVNNAKNVTINASDKINLNADEINLNAPTINTSCGQICPN